MELGLQMISQILLLPHSKSFPHVCIALDFRNDLDGELKKFWKCNCQSCYF